MKNICITAHILPWELKKTIRGLQRLSDNYTINPNINLHLHTTLNLTEYHTDWSLNKINQHDIINQLYDFIQNLKFGRKYLTILDTQEPNGHIDTWKHTFAHYYDGYIWACSDVYHHKDYLNTMLDLIAKTNHQFTWIAPVPDTETHKQLTKSDIDEGIINIIRALPGGYCMGYGWFDYISNSIIDFVGWPHFECYGPIDSFTGFIMSNIYSQIPTLDYGHYYITGNVLKPDCVELEDEEFKDNFTIKSDKTKQRAEAENDFFGHINRRVEEILHRIGLK
jgi:hypothetical protein